MTSLHNFRSLLDKFRKFIAGVASVKKCKIGVTWAIMLDKFCSTFVQLCVDVKLPVNLINKLIRKSARKVVYSFIA